MSVVTQLNSSLKEILYLFKLTLIFWSSTLTFGGSGGIFDRWTPCNHTHPAWSIGQERRIRTLMPLSRATTNYFVNRPIHFKQK